jgi:hypothetical protein
MHRPIDDPEEALQNLLVELFRDPPEALREVHAFRYGDVVDATDWSGSLRSQAFSLVTQLVQHGVLQRGPAGDRPGTRAYFELLAADRARQHARIAAVAASWGVVDLPVAPVLAAAVSRPAWTRQARTWWIAGGLLACVVVALIQGSCSPRQFGESCGKWNKRCDVGLQCAANDRCLRAGDGRCGSADDCAVGMCVDGRCSR